MVDILPVSAVDHLFDGSLELIRASVATSGG
jgi:hypothetical protein